MRIRKKALTTPKGAEKKGANLSKMLQEVPLQKKKMSMKKTVAPLPKKKK